jgi:hypothetical protein
MLKKASFHPFKAMSITQMCGPIDPADISRVPNVKEYCHTIPIRLMEKVLGP